MTNLDYVKSLLDSRKLVETVFGLNGFDLRSKIYDAHKKWATENTRNTGNVTYNTKTGEEYTDNEMLPSIWLFEWHHHSDGTRTKDGRTMNVSYQQFLDMPYDKKYWD